MPMSTKLRVRIVSGIMAFAFLIAHSFAQAGLSSNIRAS